MITSYKDLDVYKEAYLLTLDIYKIVENYPRTEERRIIDQIVRAALSVPLNIAEGYGKKDSSADFKRFLRMAMGSCNEISVLLELSKDLGYINQDEYIRLIGQYDVLGKRLNVLIQKWK